MTIAGILNAAGITQAALSQELGIPYRTVQDWAAGRRQPPEYLIRLIAEHYGIE